ncbi:TPA: phage tail tape measure protein [Streptococcus pneumoniae]|uniref:phage tail tape measure protein n=1 Tax=Streptococcus pneumoniae TaxID=1313 RepID=UPI0010EED9FD|nr:phage tail tape measure protein [Streptococcus pneumoniae]NMH07764.1 phage tail tape measure protein [Streptococcus pneumoniae]VMM35883.1 prophage LambdaSa04, tail tape measure protein, TP901 family [Streptococcus pneumoniae]VRQ59857.1 prophage LambdaSa04, tail tape measure protein, TP901 family [Streptococcus pneumoniae]HEV6101546.1 phage tail tape measure protein [Streptococcus pneumoniae]HEV6177695.1 phage tail tape measure protein [Streptococcus pneumoniae]
MAGNIKGIKIEIDGDTQPLQKALKNVNKAATDASQELRQIDKALKFDTGNVTLLTQKQEVLQKQVSTTKEKLETLRQAQSQVEQQFKNGDIGADQYRAFQREVEVTQNVLKGYEGKLANVNQALNENGSATQNNKNQLKELQNEQSQLASEMVKVTSSFKLQESALGSNASEAERNALAQKKIGAQSEIVSKQISNLEQQLEITKKEFGENSTQANRMEAELNQAKTAFNHLNDEMKGTKSAADSTQESLSEISRNLRAELLQQFSEKLSAISEKLVEVGKEALEAAAQMQASNAQFTTVFGDMETQAREALNAIGQEMDIVPERLQGSFTQMASFAKTSGLDTAQALDLTSRATRAAADGAAFYDKSIESVSESLQSFLKGNFANDAALGISATETTRNAAANKLYGKSFKDLSEAQKQLTLLQMVEDGNKLSGALGQAARESDGLENVMGNLKQAGTNALSAIGQPLLEMMIPVFQTLATIVKGVAELFNSLPDPVKDFIVILGVALTIVGALAPIFLTLQAVFMSSFGAMIAAALPIIGIISGVVVAIAAIVAIVKYLWETNESFRDAVTTVWNAILEVINAVVSEISNFVMSIFGTVVTWWTENQELIRTSAETVWNAIYTVISTILDILGPLLQAGWDNIQLIITTTWEIIKIVVETAINVVLGVIQAVMQIITGDWSGAWETIKGVFSTVWQAIQSIVQTIFSAIQSYISNILNGISGTVSNIWNSIKDTVSNVLNAISSTVSSVWEGIKSTISSAINGARDAVSSAIEAIKGLFNFNISWPHIPLPHFYVSGSANPLDWLSQGVPSIGIEWYAKGGIMTKPTIFGMNGNNIMVGGEAGNEAVLPLNDKTLGAIGRGIAQTMGGTSPTINITITGNTVREEADISRIADEVAQRIADELQRRRQLRGGFA